MSVTFRCDLHGRTLTIDGSHRRIERQLASESAGCCLLKGYSVERLRRIAAEGRTVMRAGRARGPAREVIVEVAPQGGGGADG